MSAPTGVERLSGGRVDRAADCMEVKPVDLLRAMALSWQKLDDYCLHSADGRYWLAATYDDEAVVYLATRLDRIDRRANYVVLGRRRAPIDDREARDTAISELRAVCAEDDARGR